tara:strand:+ start:538 stop:1242 length:705 start_codon:yes stop_codon:yes gene_type:complete
MADIFASDTDGYITSGYQASWDAARDATSGQTPVTGGNAGTFIGTSRSSTRGGGNNYIITRAFMWFDTSGISGNVSAATISIRGWGSSTACTPIIMKSTAFGGDGGTALASGDFDSFSSTEYGSFVGQGTWDTSDYNDMPSTSDLRADMQNNDIVIFCIMDYGNDERDVALTSNATNATHAYYANTTGTDYDPKITYTEDAASGYTHNVMGVAAGNIGKVLNVATANIGKVIGV